ncbi:MAG: response regulator transcription factor [Bacilli bacterium]|nr:response regulator transcription factor [Bacilli bacterium]MDE6142113.1 response regulator transcription factor [Bacilli bacterium]
MMKILLVEDNQSIVKGLVYALEQNKYEVIVKTTIKDTISFLEDNKIDLIILDVSLPDGNGFDLYKEYIRDTKTIFLTARDTEDDIVLGLELGADDYITKPFSTRELLARINRILINNRDNRATVKDITFDFNKMEVSKNGNVINLSSLELKILSLLFNNLNKVVSRQVIIERIWEWTGNDVYDNTVTVYMKRIREKLESDIIITLKGVGYRIDEK